MEITIDQLLRQAADLGASDLHLTVDLPPQARIDGAIGPLLGYPIIDKEMMEELIGSLLTDDRRSSYAENRSVDFSHAVVGLARFRVNCFLERGRLAAVFRRIPEDIPTLAELSAPAVLLDFARSPRGLVLVTGPTGSGKSTTLAAILDLINSERQDHILTIEDPIEFVHKPKRCLVRQREVGTDTPSFAKALVDALREDPDVILVGEMRDLETIQTALTAAETGHLVFGTLHTSSAPSSVDRIVDVFPAGQQQQVRVMLAQSLVGIITQTLLPKTGGGRIAAFEVMAADNAVRALIRHQGGEQLRSVMQTQSQKGMQTMDRCLAHLVFRDQISADAAREKTQNIDEFEQLLTALRKGGDVAALPIVEADQLISMTPLPPPPPSLLGPEITMPPPPQNPPTAPGESVLDMPPPPQDGDNAPPPPQSPDTPAGVPMPPQDADTLVAMPPPPQNLDTPAAMPPPPEETADEMTADDAQKLSKEVDDDQTVAVVENNLGNSSKEGVPMPSLTNDPATELDDLPPIPLPPQDPQSPRFG